MLYCQILLNLCNRKHLMNYISIIIKCLTNYKAAKYLKNDIIT